MTWAVIPGSPYGGLPPAPQLDDLPTQLLYQGDPLTLTGTGFTPGTQVILDPGGQVIATSSPTDTTSITLTVPFGLPNVLHRLHVTNGGASNSIELFVLRDVTLSTAIGVTAEVTVIGAN